MKPGMDKRVFSRKARALQDLAERGKLYKVEKPVRIVDPREYKKGILDQAKKQKLSDGRIRDLRNKLDRMDVDHLHDL